MGPIIRFEAKEHALEDQMSLQMAPAALRRIGRKVFEKVGYRVERIEAKERHYPLSADMESVFDAILAYQEQIVIVQIGANDGKTNDPIYEPIRRRADHCRVLLIEPQTSLIGILENNYRFLNKKTIFNGAIGEEGKLNLFTVKESYWDKIRPHYAKDWPVYRAPTGIASSDRSAVERWITQHGSGIQPSDALEEVVVPCHELETVLNITGFDDKIDIIQIDAEGFDDIVIFKSNLDMFKPKVIRFEHKLLGKRRYDEIISFLLQRGYIHYQSGPDTVAIRIASD